MFSILLTSCSKAPISVSNKITAPITIDGNANEWSNSFEYDRATKIQYAVNSDQNDLFVCLKVSNNDLERKIKVYGLTLWIDTTGKKKQQIGIRYPIGSRNLSSKTAQGSMKNQNVNEMKEERSNFLSATHEIEIKGFKVLQDLGNEFYRTDAKSKIGIHAALDFDSTNAMIYELKIPLNLIYADISKPSSSLGLTFLTGSMDMKEREENFEDPNRPGTVQTGMAGYATGNRAGMPKSAQYFNMIEPTELRLKISTQ